MSSTLIFTNLYEGLSRDMHLCTCNHLSTRPLDSLHVCLELSRAVLIGFGWRASFSSQKFKSTIWWCWHLPIIGGFFKKMWSNTFAFRKNIEGSSSFLGVSLRTFLCLTFSGGVSEDVGNGIWLLGWSRSPLAKGLLAEECYFQTIILIPNEDGDFCGIRLAEVVWKTVTGILNCRLAAAI